MREADEEFRQNVIAYMEVYVRLLLKAHPHMQYADAVAEAAESAKILDSPANA